MDHLCLYWLELTAFALPFIQSSSHSHHPHNRCFGIHSQYENCQRFEYFDCQVITAFSATWEIILVFSSIRKGKMEVKVSFSSNCSLILWILISVLLNRNILAFYRRLLLNDMIKHPKMFQFADFRKGSLNQMRGVTSCLNKEIEKDDFESLLLI